MTEQEQMNALMSRIGSKAKVIMSMTDPTVNNEDNLEKISETDNKLNEEVDYNTFDNYQSEGLNNKTEERIKTSEDFIKEAKLINETIYGAKDAELEKILQNSKLPDVVKEAYRKHKITAIDPTELLSSVNTGLTAAEIQKKFGAKILQENKEKKLDYVDNKINKNVIEKKEIIKESQDIKQNIERGTLIDEIRNILREEINFFLTSNKGNVLMNINDDVKIAIGDDVYKAKIEYIGKRKKK